jgi:hypothetical protein
MEFIFEALMPWMLLIASGCLILSLILLVMTNRYTRKKLEEMNQEDSIAVKVNP